MNTNQERQRLVIGNWKMNGNLADNARLLGSVLEGVAGVGACSVAVCVPFPYLAQAQAALSGSAVSWGAQDVSVHGSGAYTGEVSAAMLNDFACRWVLVGHSERRTYHAETNELVAQKAKVALDAGLTPVVCVGETLQQQAAGETAQVITSQLAPVLALGAQAVAKMIIAYEPVWAIGTGLTATPQQAQDVHALIRKLLSELGVAQVQVLYGGSVKGANAASLFAMPDIDGALVGGAALVAEEFLSIAAA
ncbi:MULTISPECIES: triose-phosphate isomerase [unclassified Pusillimonas]|uniref:triose-phosphate isomerase n=1 Tax=unclassified Pusillimonas TaxID=2640016 RepID=UPI000B9D16D5|nr:MULTISPECIES: triose-phosphate isomerase [unclassified Pusillimonas]OXR50443.1 triose-phosphate isomerase [Pusillimonas sp. T2]ROT44588.1 triose-phosphate isomerase [Pusillimonas sp. NJUB218]